MPPKRRVELIIRTRGQKLQGFNIEEPDFQGVSFSSSVTPAPTSPLPQSPAPKKLKKNQKNPTSSPITSPTALSSQSSQFKSNTFPSPPASPSTSITPISNTPPTPPSTKKEKEKNSTSSSSTSPTAFFIQPSSQKNTLMSPLMPPPTSVTPIPNTPLPLHPLPNYQNQTKKILFSPPQNLPLGHHPHPPPLYCLIMNLHLLHHLLLPLPPLALLRANRQKSLLQQSHWCLLNRKLKMKKMR